MKRVGCLKLRFLRWCSYTGYLYGDGNRGLEWMAGKIIECGNDHSMDVILVIKAGFGTLKNIHLFSFHIL